MPDDTALYGALAARDTRFDGVFYVGVTSTGIYCRPVCTARTPRRTNCRFYSSREAAEKAGFRPCLRCRPELAPGNAPVDDAGRIAALVAQRIDEGLLDDGGGLEVIAERFGWSSRQIRRILQKELGVSPMELVLTRRLLLAKQLLTETTLPVTDIAFASGFSSIRRFNDAFLGRYRLSPTRFRRGTGATAAPDGDVFTVQLGYREPFAWEPLLAFLASRAIPGVENVAGDAWMRTARLGEHTGWVRVTNSPATRSLRVDVTHSLTPALPALLGRLRNLFDLGARPDLINEHLVRDRRLARAVRLHPGMRVPGAIDGFELAVRAILGQQITVAGATTLAGRFARAFGQPLSTPHRELALLSPRAVDIADRRVDRIAALGIPGARARSILALARLVARGDLELEPGSEHGRVVEQLMKVPGIGPWTAQYIAMRALRWPDAFPREDMVIRRALGGVTPAEAERLSKAWSPWRSYAVLHLWRS